MNSYRHLITIIEGIGDLKLKKLVNKYRTEMEIDADWRDNKSCFNGMCLTYTKELVDILQHNGFPDAIATSGYYVGVEDAYLDNIDHNDEDDLSNWDNRWKHWWIRVDGVIVDITADQFHPSEPENYRVVITDLGDQHYETGAHRE